MGDKPRTPSLQEASPTTTTTLTQDSGGLNFLKSQKLLLLIKWMFNKKRRTSKALRWPCHVGTLIQWRKSFTCWCKHPNISMARRMKSSLGCHMQYDTIFAWAIVIVATPWEKMTHETRFTRIKSTMTTFAKVWVPSIVRTISIHRHDDWKDGIRRIWVCSHKTWNPTSLTMEMKESRITSCVPMCSPPWIQRSRCIVSLLNLWPSNICIDKDHELWDGGGLIWCVMLKRKCQRPS
jgi:hypothetical protein